MVSQAEARFVRTSPRKARLVVDLIRGRRVDEALNVLHYTPKAVARTVSKLLESAVANAAQQPEINTDDLYVKEIWVNGGPTIKRIKPRAMGRAMLIRKRMCHIKIILDEQG